MNNKINFHLADRFTGVFEENVWKDNETVSGPGSRLDSPAVVSAVYALNQVIIEYGIKSIADVPCGDFNWMNQVTKSHPAVAYVGYDIVAPLIAKNKARWPETEFRILDITMSSAATVDLIFSKELFIHLTVYDTLLALENIRQSGSKYLMSLNHFNCGNKELERDIGGYCRALDLCSSPYNWPSPIYQCGITAYGNYIQVNVERQ